MAGVRVNSPDWIVRNTATRGVSAATFADFPAAFLASQARVSDTIVVQPAAATRAAGPSTPAPLDISCDLAPGEAAILAIRHPSQALTFHRPTAGRSRGVRPAGEARFVVAVRSTERGGTTRGLVGSAVQAIIIKIAKVAADKGASLLLPRLATSYETSAWKKQGLREGWVRVSKAALAARRLTPARPAGAGRALLLLHGTFSHTAAAFGPLAAGTFFDRVAATYGSRIYGFNHFSISRTPEENARLLLEGLPASFRGTFDVVTHSRGGLVLRQLVEGAASLGRNARRFQVGRAVLVASPNGGTPLATPQRWEDTVGWVANLLELFPDNPLTTGAEFVANGLVWLARHASGDLPGLQAMDADGDFIHALQGRPGPPAAAYSALVSNYHPTDKVYQRLLDTGVDQFFGGANDLVVPSAGGWLLDKAGASIPGERIGCFGAGGNLTPSAVSHVDFFKQPETADFLVAALAGQPQALPLIDPAATLPDNRLPRIGRGALRGFGDRSVAAVVAAEPSQPPLRVSVINGDLTFESEALLIGHYRSTRLTGTERVMNGLIGGEMEHSLNLGVYPHTPGSALIFLNTVLDPENPTGLPRPQAVIVVGLGEEGKLRPVDLSMTVRQATIAWARRLTENPAQGGKEGIVERGTELAATLIGSGGTGITAGQAAQYIAQGVHEANVLLGQPANSRAWPRVTRLRLVELYLDRAAEAWRALKMLSVAAPTRFVVDEVVHPGLGELPRALESGYRGADYDFITAESQEQSTQIAYTLDTRRARAEVRAQKTQGPLLRDLIATASNDRNTDEQIGRTLFKLLIPIEMESYLASAGEMQIQVDSGTAGIPWELLDADEAKPGEEAQLPWAIRARLLRKLKTIEFRAQVNDASAGASVLVIGEPACPAAYPRLAGARLEAHSVCKCLTDGGFEPERLSSLIASDDMSEAGPDARAVVNALFSRDWRIVHISGHGALPEGAASGGVVLSNGSFLGPDEIATMRTVPELVFVNCCHLAARDPEQLLQDDGQQRFDKARFAAGVAEKLIEIGVRCVIAAGWAVDDEAASAFATTFYDSLLRGERFIDAVARARRAAYDHQGNTWAAYQCYGDPDWLLTRDVPDAQRPPQTFVDEFAAISSAAALRLALETISVRVRFQRAKQSDQLSRVRVLEERFAKQWGSAGNVAEAFGHACKDAGDPESAIGWYRKALAANDGTASLKAAEQMANLRVRRAWQRVEKGKPAEARGAGARAWQHTVEEARQEIRDVTALLDSLVALEPTLERLSIYGSAFKRLAMIEESAGRGTEARKALEGMKARYHAAQALGIKHNDANVFYPAMNALTADLLLNGSQARWKGLPAGIVEVARRSMEARAKSDPDFWSVVGLVELELYERVAAKTLAAGLRGLEDAFEDVHRRVAASWLWWSVADNVRMVLTPYLKATGRESEKKAGAALLKRLMSYANAAE